MPTVDPGPIHGGPSFCSLLLPVLYFLCAGIKLSIADHRQGCCMRAVLGVRVYSVAACGRTSCWVVVSMPEVLLPASTNAARLVTRIRALLHASKQAAESQSGNCSITARLLIPPVGMHAAARACRYGTAARTSWAHHSLPQLAATAFRQPFQLHSYRTCAQPTNKFCNFTSTLFQSYAPLLASPPAMGGTLACLTPKHTHSAHPKGMPCCVVRNIARYM